MAIPEDKMAGQIEARLAELGVMLPSPAPPAFSYVPTVLSGNQLFISGQLPMQAGKLAQAGQLGTGAVSVEAGAAAARLCAISLLVQAKAALGELDRVARVVKVAGFVSSTAEFGEQPKVVNGASDFLVEVFGDRGKHARSAIGVAALPFGASVEVEAVFEVA
jgi:enamine deaminase RidA (YjgF/YER057c/UK114 family)